MGLRDYRRKRDFTRTPEPAGSPRSGGEKRKPLFVIQKHAARRLHYDFRLELDGVLKSWAVPKGPSLDPGVKRLAVHVEDHPVDYGDFEGVIPQGEYGGGTVMLWDRGWWEPKDDPQEGYAKGNLKFTLHGDKLHGSWALVRMGRREGEKADNWLLIKERDAEARPGSEDAVVAQELHSVASGRDIAGIAEDADRVWSSKHGELTAKGRRGAAMTEKKRAAKAVLDPAEIAGAKRAKRAPTISPQLATPAQDPPGGDQWLHEIKFDGYRMLAYLAGGKVELRTRNDLDWTRRFPELAAALAELEAAETLLDGEVVHIEKDGVTSFSALQEDLSEKATQNLVYMVFDLLFLEGWDLTGATTEDRKAVLKSLLESDAAGKIRYSDHQIGKGPEFFAGACGVGLEGIVSKRRDAPYRAGRSAAWIKVKCGRREELVVVGYTDPAGARAGFGALLLGYRKPEGGLVYAGKTGTGYTEKTLAQLRKKLGAIEQKQPTVTLPKGVSLRGVHWVKPKLVAEIAFAEWTKDSILRQSRFLGLREDKSAEEVVLDPTARAEPRSSAPAPVAGAAVARDGAAIVRGVRITHAERPVFPEPGISKLAVAEYYAAVAERILPHIARRPLSLLRCPDGLAGKCFFQKHLAAGMPASIQQVPILEKDGVENYVMIEEASGLLTLVQMGVLEIHPWGSTVDQLEKPDRLIFDLDPDEGLAWNRVIAAAIAVRDRLEGLGLRSFAKTTGGKGLHVVVPVKPSLDWDAAKEFTRALVAKLAGDEPTLYTSSLAKNARRGRLFIDYLRNGRGATAVGAYSTRAKRGATVSAPLTWEEVGSGIRSDQFTIANLPQRLAALRRDPWADFFTTKQTISAAARRKLGVS